METASTNKPLTKISKDDIIRSINLNMKTFNITRNLQAYCRSEKTRYGFRHLAELHYKGNEVGTAKCCYYNRTWERFEFESVLEKLIGENEFLSKTQKARALKYLADYNERDPFFKTIALVSKIGGIIADDQKSQNDWKLRMIKAGLENRGLTIPDDWNELTENEKQRRLDETIAVLEGGEK